MQKSFFFTLLCLLLVTCTVALAATSDFTWTEIGSTGQVSLYRYTGTDTYVYVPDVSSGRTVVAIGDRAFQGNGATTVSLPYSVTRIGENAFSGMANLQSITMLGSVTQIGARAFQYCTKLSSITLPGTLTTLSDGLFSGCTSLVTVALPSSLLSVGESTFAQCTSLRGLDLPESVTTIADYAFAGCTSLVYLTLPPTLETLSTQAFVNCPNITYIVKRDSQSETVCKQRGLFYVYADSQQASILRAQAASASSSTQAPSVVVMTAAPTAQTVLTTPMPAQVTVEPTAAPTWKSSSKGWRYIYGDGSYAKNTWLKIDGKWYHFAGNGYMEKNVWSGDYYLGDDGSMVTDSWVDGYYVGPDGAWNQAIVSDEQHTVGRWKQDNRGWRYVYSNGTVAQSQWLQLEGKWYYLAADGYMVCGNWVENCYLKQNGEMAQDTWVGTTYVGSNGKAQPGQKQITPTGGTWIQDTKGWWYQYPDGTYPSNQWAEIDGEWYHFTSKGYMEANKWIDNTYYVTGSGVMARDTWIDSGKYYVDLDGHYVEHPDPATADKLPLVMPAGFSIAEWQSRYLPFMQSGYQTSDQRSAYAFPGSPVLFALYDLNRDTLPELLVQGSDGLHVYTVTQHTLQHVGIIPGNTDTLFWYDTENAPGLFQATYPASMPGGSVLTYYTLKDSVLTATSVAGDSTLSRQAANANTRQILTTISNQTAQTLDATSLRNLFAYQAHLSLSPR